jgi:hypothetical protein
MKNIQKNMALVKKTVKSRKPLRKPKSKTKGYYVKKLDIIFSQYIRKSYANDFGMAECYTCNKVLHYKDLQNGHFISRGHMNTRWDEANCRPQCVGCNVFMNGNYTEYSYRLLKEIGECGMDELMEKKKEMRQFSIQELQELIKKYAQDSKDTSSL